MSYSQLIADGFRLVDIARTAAGYKRRRDEFLSYPDLYGDNTGFAVGVVEGWAPASHPSTTVQRPSELLAPCRCGEPREHSGIPDIV
jgi:hypothetical protein